MTNFIRKHSLLAMLFVLAMMLNLTSCLSTADLTKSQRVGAKHSPAAIYAVSVHGNAGVYAVDAVKKYMNEALTNDAGFTLLDQETMDVVCDEAKKKSIEKAKKRAGFKNVMGVLSGRKSIAGAIHDGMSLDDVGYKRKDVLQYFRSNFEPSLTNDFEEKDLEEIIDYYADIRQATKLNVKQLNYLLKEYATSHTASPRNPPCWGSDPLSDRHSVGNRLRCHQS